MQSDPIDKLAVALSKAQAVMAAAAKNKRNPHFNSRYADLASIIEAVRKPLTDNGLAFTQTITGVGPGLFLETTLLHTSGQWIKSEYPLLQGTAQQTGSSLTYARRYSLSSIAGIAADEDDDGAAATKAQPHKAPVKATDDDLLAEHDPPVEPRPYKISAQSWRMFDEILTRELRAAESKSDVFEWLDLNKSNLDAMKEKFPKMYETLSSTIEAVKAEPT